MKQEFIFSLITFLIFGILKTRKSFHMLQQNWYDKSFRYLKWCFRNVKKSFLAVDILVIPLIIACYFLKVEYIYYIIAIAYIFVTYVYFKITKGEQVKKPLAFTARLKRLSVTMLIIYAIPIAIILK